jgi:predicted nucleic acid-binding Zn ribbon protein
MRPKKCAVCGRVGEHGLYCSNKCKQIAYRRRQEKKRLGNLSGISSMLIDLIGMSEAMSAFDHLNQLAGKKNQEQAGEAIAVIVYAMQSRLNAQRDEWIEST